MELKTKRALFRERSLWPRRLIILLLLTGACTAGGSSLALLFASSIGAPIKMAGLGGALAGFLAGLGASMGLAAYYVNVDGQST